MESEKVDRSKFSFYVTVTLEGSILKRVS